ncbi:MAG: PIN domain-containing protein [Chitinispirillaceae bacterium]|nr:PIN domain-containing protein [Chitinispirillaceae bacterium]
MNVLVDTCVWSYALRHKKPNIEIKEKLKDIISDGRLAIIGPIRQEILSGVSSENQFESLKEHLSPFEDIPLHSNHFITAAEFHNICMKKGIQGSHTDFLICSISYLEKLKIFTTDLDFTKYKKHLPIELL